MKIVGYMSMIVLCLITTLFIVYVGYLTFYPFNVIDIKNTQNLPVDKEVYTAGEYIRITFDYKKYLDIAPEVKKELLCDRSVVELISERRLPMGAGVVQLPHIIPLSTPTDDHCRIFIFLSYRINPLQTQEINLRTEEFRVTNSKL